MEWSSVQLRSLAELARRGTITAVAHALGYTPGGVSQQLGALEKAAGVALLRRAGRRVELTDAGRALAGHAERMLAVEAEAVAALEQAGTATGLSGLLEIGLFATAAAEILPVALARVQHRYPELIVRSREMDVDEVYDAVASGGVDLALGLDYPDMPIPRDPSLRLVRLYRERFSVAAPRALPSVVGGPGVAPRVLLAEPSVVGGPGGAPRVLLADMELVSLSDLGDLDWILPPADSHYGRAARTVCRRAGIEPRVRHEVTDTAASLALVEAGVGISPVTGLMLRLRSSRLNVVRLAEVFERNIVVIVRATAQTRPTVAALVAVLGELAGDDGQGQQQRP